MNYVHDILRSNNIFCALFLTDLLYHACATRPFAILPNLYTIPSRPAHKHKERAVGGQVIQAPNGANFLRETVMGGATNLQVVLYQKEKGSGFGIVIQRWTKRADSFETALRIQPICATKEEAATYTASLLTTFTRLTAERYHRQGYAIDPERVLTPQIIEDIRKKLVTDLVVMRYSGMRAA